MVLLVEPKPIPGLDASQRQDAETGVFLAALAVVVPLALVGGPRLAGAVARGPNGRALSGLAALLTLGLAAVLLTARIADRLAGGGTEVLLGGAVLWAAAAAAGLARAGSARPWPPAARLPARARVLWIAAAVAVAATPLVVVPAGTLSVVALALGAVLVFACVRGRAPALSGRPGLAVDIAAIALLLLVIPDLVVVRPEDPALPALDRYLASIMQLHHNFLIGPANQVMGGDVLLQDTASQYGVGSIYLLAGWFELATISYGSLALLDGLLTAGLFAIAYLVLRMAGCSRVVAGTAMAVAVVALVFNRVYAVGMLPQEGPLRFGLPMGVILAAVVAAARPGRARLAHAAAAALVGVSAIWSLEAFAATAAVFAAVACVEAGLRAPGERMPLLGRRAMQGLGAIAAAHLLFTAATLAGTGELPGWGQYLAFLDQFLLGPLGDLTYDFSRWSVGLALGAGYLTSALALLLVLRLRPALAAERRVAITALTGVTAYGLVLFAYFVDRSADHVLVYVGLPAVMAGALWLGLVLDSSTHLDRDVRAGAVAAAAAACVLLVSVGWSSVERPLGRSALSQFVPGGDSPRAAVARLRAFPAIDRRAPEGERLLDARMPGEDRSVVLVEPDLTVEILTRRKRINALPFSNPREDDFTFDERLPGILGAVSELPPGRRILVDSAALSSLAAVRRNPRSRLRNQGGRATSILQVRALEAIDRRFRMRVVERGAGGLTVMELARR